jgi:Cu(I)/Ag(I) efflux system membrane fusion protein/cobalt-zinc-cadmium efflux system membrane fusion protein
MNIDQFHKQAGRVLIPTIVLTVVITLLIAGTAAWYAGYLGPREKAGGDMTMQAEDETLYTCGMHPQIIQEEPGNCPICGMKLVPKKKDKGGEKTSGEREIAYWRAPMNPNEIYDEPGKSAMGMDLIPVYEDELVGGVNISIDPVVELNMGIRTTEVKRGPLTHTIRTYGHITYDETRMTRINLKFSGWLEKLHVDFTGEMVQKGQPLFDIYSPELITAQQDLIEASRNYRARPTDTSKKVLDSVRRRLSYFDIGEGEISEIEKSGAVRQAVTIRSPFSGVVMKKDAFEGTYVASGTTVYEIADLSRVWVEAHIYEYELAAVQKGQPVDMTLPYLPGKHYSGRVSYVYPYLQRQTRDVVVRLEFDNPDLELKPDMYADVKIRTSVGETGIKIPARSVIRTGERNIVFIRRAPGEFTPREVTLGMPLDGGMVRVLKGVAPGETIVTSGQFMLDSESKLNESVQKLTPPDAENTSKTTEKTDESVETEFFEELENDNK